MVHIPHQKKKNLLSKRVGRDFCGSPVVKNPAANAGDMGSICGLGWFHVPWGN